MEGGPAGGGRAPERELGEAVKQKLTSGLKKMGSSLTAVRTKLTAGKGREGASEGVQPARSALPPATAQQARHEGEGATRATELAGAGAGWSVDEGERDVLVRLGLAAFAVAAYIKTVLCPSLPAHAAGAAAAAGLTGADSPLTPTLRTLTAAHQRRTSSLAFEEGMLRELDMVLEARGELDLLDSLAQTPLLAAPPRPYTPLLEDLSRLLAATPGIPVFQGRLAGAVMREGWERHTVGAILRAE